MTGTELHDLRTARGWTQRELGTKAGFVNHAARRISHYETGYRGITPLVAAHLKHLLTEANPSTYADEKPEPAPVAAP